MFKKLLSCAILLGSLSTATAQHRAIKLDRRNADSKVLLNAQTNLTSAKTTSLAEMDTLWYFYNKQKFINLGTQAGQSFYTIQGTSVGTSTNGDLVEFGSSFLNTSANSPVTVSGALVLLSRAATSASASIPVRVYLYNASTSGFPTTKVDSVNINVTSTSGNFLIANFATPKTVAGSFFISYKMMSTNTLDTLLAWVTSASTATSSAPPSEKFGEGLSYTRAMAPGGFDMWFSNTNFYGVSDGFDFEAVVVPMVSYSINANFTAPAPTPSLSPAQYCTGKQLNFINTTNPNSIVYNRQFNFNQFINVWKSIAGNTTNPLDPADPINNWTFSNCAVTTLTTSNASNTVTIPGNFSVTLDIKYRHSPFQPGDSQVNDIDTKTASYDAVVCTTTVTGINEIGGFENVNVYPNPTLSGKTTITGLSGANTIMTYDMLGQLVSTQSTDKETLTIDLLNRPNGNYITKIINSNGNIKVVKIINQN